MNLLGKFFSKKAAGAAQKAIMIGNKDLMEATVAISCLVMHVSGGASADERSKTETVLTNNEALAAFGPLLTDTFNKYDRLCSESGFLIAKTKLMREIADVKGSQEEKEDVFVTGITIAAADGDVDEKELALLKQIGQALGLRVEDYL